jgi:hypothetical protein
MQPFDFSKAGDEARMKRIAHEKEFQPRPRKEPKYRCTIVGLEDWVLDAFEIAALQLEKPDNVEGCVANHFVKI